MPVGLTVCGAAREVTGLCLLFEAPEARVLVDCGMFQGPKTLKALNYEPFPFDPRSIDAVLLTHAHIDHSGLLPKLVKHGFRGRIHATEATRDLCSVMLPDSGSIQESEVDQLNRRNRRRGREIVQPIYTAEDAERTMVAFDPVAYGQWIVPAKACARAGGTPATCWAPPRSRSSSPGATGRCACWSQATSARMSARSSATRKVRRRASTTSSSRAPMATRTAPPSRPRCGARISASSSTPRGSKALRC
jgi:hypothetical protein